MVAKNRPARRSRLIYLDCVFSPFVRGFARGNGIQGKETESLFHSAFFKVPAPGGRSGCKSTRRSTILFLPFSRFFLSFFLRFFFVRETRQLQTGNLIIPPLVSFNLTIVQSRLIIAIGYFIRRRLLKLPATFFARFFCLLFYGLPP